MKQELPDGDWVMQFTILPDDVPCEVRVRKLLKGMLRWLRMRMQLVRPKLPGEDLRRPIAEEVAKAG